MIQPTCHSCEGKSIGSAEGDSSPLCFVAFQLLKENSKIIIEANESVPMQNHAKSMEHNDKVSQQSFYVLEGPITCAKI